MDCKLYWWNLLVESCQVREDHWPRTGTICLCFFAAKTVPSVRPVGCNVDIRFRTNVTKSIQPRLLFRSAREDLLEYLWFVSVGPQQKFLLVQFHLFLPLLSHTTSPIHSSSAPSFSSPSKPRNLFHSWTWTRTWTWWKYPGRGPS